MSEIAPRGDRSAAIAGVCFILGMTVFGLLLGHGARSFKRMDEFVTVKGLSEREVPADLAVWPVTFTVGENDLALLQTRIEAGRKTVRDFLAAGGFNESEVTNAPPQIADSERVSDDEDPSRKRAFRYTARITVLLRTTPMAKTKAAR